MRSFPERLLALDIETVPDRARLPADHGTKFPKPIFHQIVAISFVEAEIATDGDGGERYSLRCCRSGGEAEWSERQLLQSFWTFFARSPARVVGWNTRAFDIPVLLQRSMLHELPALGWFGRGNRFDSYGYRYSDAWHCDLMDVICDFGACAKLGLDEAAAALGLPGKVGGHGSEVETMVAAGEMEQVRHYCEADTLNLYGVYLRHGLLTGRMSRAGYEAATTDLRDHLDRERVDRPHFGALLDLWTAKERSDVETACQASSSNVTDTSRSASGPGAAAS